MKSTTNLLQLKKSIIFHFRGIIEKIKTSGLNSEDIEKIKLMDDEEFYKIALENSDNKNIIEIRWVFFICLSFFRKQTLVVMVILIATTVTPIPVRIAQ